MATTKTRPGRTLASVCALSLALLGGCDKNPTAPSGSGDPEDLVNILPILVTLDVLVFPDESHFYPMLQIRVYPGFPTLKL